MLHAVVRGLWKRGEGFFSFKTEAGDLAAGEERVDLTFWGKDQDRRIRSAPGVPLVFEH